MISLWCLVLQIQWWSKTHQSCWKRQLDSHHWGQEVWESFGKSYVSLPTQQLPQYLDVSVQNEIKCSPFFNPSVLFIITGAGGVLSVPFAERKLQVVRYHIAIPLQVKRTLANTGQYPLTRYALQMFLFSSTLLSPCAVRLSHRLLVWYQTSANTNRQPDHKYLI